MNTTIAERTPTGEPAVIAERWSRHKVRAFELLEPANISMVSTYGTIATTTWDPNGEVKSRWGHNRGLKPVKPSTSSSRKDVATATYNKNPAFFLGTMFRVWAPCVAERDTLLEVVIDMIAAKSERDGCGFDLLNGFKDVGPDLTFGMFEFEIHCIAKDLRIPVWDAIKNELEKLRAALPEAK
jgi:hypothetical protein